MNNKIYFVLIFVMILLSGCIESENYECFSDEDCSVAGCSGQICTTVENAKNVITTCEWKPEYSCLKLTTCACIKGKCQWKPTPEYQQCLNNLSSIA